jgi:2,4-dienoyl-CoA reductase-like NADH-dependent reductase (Old Yellow Enzyme family)
MRTFSEQFLAEIEAFLTASRMRATDFGREAVGDPSFVTRLRQGRSPSLATADKVRACMRRLEARSAKAGGRR